MTTPSDPHGIQSSPDHGHGVQAHADHHHASDAPSLFSDAEWAQFRKSDIVAGGAIVGLMAGIFSIGLLLYSAIAVIVAA
jgi:hypothetical protein